METCFAFCTVSFSFFFKEIRKKISWMWIFKVLMPWGQPLPFTELLKHPYSNVNHICLLHLHFHYLCHSVYICTVSDQQAVTRDCALDVTPSCTGRRGGELSLAQPFPEASKVMDVCLDFSQAFNTYQCVEIPDEGSKEDRARLLSVVPSNRRRGNWHKWKNTQVHLTIRKHFIILKVVQLWSRSSRAIIETPSSAIETLNPSHHNHKHPAVGDAALKKGLESSPWFRSLWVCDSVILQRRNDSNIFCFYLWEAHNLLEKMPWEICIYIHLNLFHVKFILIINFNY